MTNQYHYPIKRHYKGDSVGIYFHLLTDQEIQELINSCEQELELRSQEQIQIGEA